MNNFIQYYVYRQIAEFLINNQINAHEYCESIIELAEQDSLNEDKLSGKINIKQDLQNVADVMQSISKIDSYLRSLGFKVDLSNLTFGAVERAMSQWHAIQARGGDPREAIRAKQRQNREELIKGQVKSYDTYTNYPANSTDRHSITTPNPEYSFNTVEKIPNKLKGRNSKFMSPKILNHTFDTNSQ